METILPAQCMFETVKQTYLTRKYCFNKNKLCAVHCVFAASTWGKYDEYERNRTPMQARLRIYTKHTQRVIVNVVVFHFHVFVFLLLLLLPLFYAHSLARLVCMCVRLFVIFSLNVHFICLGIKNNLIIYRINTHTHCIVLCGGVLCWRGQRVCTRARAHANIMLFLFIRQQQRTIVVHCVWCCRHCWHERVQIAICFVSFCLSLLVPIRSSLLFYCTRAIVFVVKVIHACYLYAGSVQYMVSNINNCIHISHQH